MRYSKWYTVYKCVSCLNNLSNYERMYSHGTCPHCGNTKDSTIVDYIREVHRDVYDSPRWMFWKNPIGIEVKENIETQRKES